MLQCENLEKKYFSSVAVNRLSMVLEPGKIYALLGPNGSGKTTLMKMIGGLVKPTSGEISFNDFPIGVESKKHIAYMPTESYFYSYMTAKDIAKYYKDFFEDFDENRYWQLIDRMELPKDLKVTKMSSGMMAKTKLAATLARNSQLVMLDEPLNGIDIIAREQIINTIIEAADGQRTIVMSSHLVDELEKIIDYAIFMKAGSIVLQGDAETLRMEQGMSIVDMYKNIYAHSQEM